MTIYKYLHPDRTDVLRGRSIRFSPPVALNDPFELNPHIDALASPGYIDSELDRIFPEMLKEELGKLPPELRKRIGGMDFQLILASLFPQVNQGVHDMVQMLKPSLQEQMHGTFAAKLGILCLSKSADSLLMWAHYADSHRGFVIGFDETAPFFDQRVTSDDELRHLRRVVYSDKRPSIVLSDVTDFTPFMTKGREWEYEAEWRMLMLTDAASSILGEGPQAIHLFEFPAHAVKSVILGCCMADSKKAEIRKLLAEASHYRNVHCFQANIDREHYRVNVSELT